ncbi:hypothetical protein V8C37DRAFT_313889 [Trichoderma ceciliae]
MKLNISAVYTLAASGIAIATVSNSFAGSSLYFLPGLSSSDQAYYIDTLAYYGAKVVVRVWINQLSTGCVKGSNVVTGVQDFETTIGTYNWDTLANLDKVLAQLVAKGMKGGNGSYPGNTCWWGCEGWGCSSSVLCQSTYSYEGEYCEIFSWGCAG